MSTRRDPIAAIAALPELPLEPFELAGTLAHARRGPYVTILPPERSIPAPPPPPPHAEPKADTETREYFAQVTYPYLLCTSPGELLEGLVLDPGVAHAAPPPHEHGAPSPDLPAPAAKTLARTERHYKLSALNGRRFAHPLFCTVRGGPWTAFVTETESCLTGVPNQWELGIYGIPEVYMLWYGEWTDRPAFPNLTVFAHSLHLRRASRQCCPGYQWCPTTQACIPHEVNCQGTTPV